MKIEVNEQKENKLLKRKEIRAYVEHNGSTPKMDDVRQAMVEKLGVKPELLVVLKIAQEAGRKRAKVLARVYSNKDDMLKTEPHYILVRNRLIEKESKDKNEEKSKEEGNKEKPTEATKK